MNKLDWEEDFKQYFHESWHPYIQPVIESEWMYNIYKVIINSRERVLPASSDVFKSFTTNFHNIHTVLVLSDPYPWVKKGKIVADGIPMSCSYTNEQQPSLVKFYEALGKEYGITPYPSTDLSYLLNQGCFLINTALTVKQNKVGSHSKLWKPFTTYLFSEILSKKQGIVYWLMGAEARAFKGAINPLGNYIIETTHPASAAHKGTEWDSKGSFKSINTVIKNNFGEFDQILWDEKEYIKEINSVPF